MTNNTVSFNGFKGEKLTINTSNLSDLETKVMINARTNYFVDICKVGMAHPKALFSGLFGLGAEETMDAIASLTNKGYMGIVSVGTCIDDNLFYLTDEGKKLYSDYEV